MVDVHVLLNDALIGVLGIAIVAIFLAAIAWEVRSSFVGAAPNARLSYVETVIAGIVLSVASGVLGTPADLPKQSEKSTVSSATSMVQSPVSPPAKQQLTPSEEQKQSAKNLYAWAYVVAGVVCLAVFVIRDHPTDLVKQVGLTMLGFLVTLGRYLL